MRPFSIVKDRGFLKLMKTGRPNYYIPSPVTVSRDMKTVFIKCRQRIAHMLQVSRCTKFDGGKDNRSLNVATRWRFELRDRCVDLTKSQGIRRCHHSLRGEGASGLNAA